jgi:hypothetical protein
VSRLAAAAIAVDPSQSLSFNPITLAQYGVLGLVVIALLLGWLWARPAVDRLIKDKERAEHQRDEMLKVYEDRVLPVLTQLTQLTQAQTPLMHDLLDALERVLDAQLPSAANGPHQPVAPPAARRTRRQGG